MPERGASPAWRVDQALRWAGEQLAGTVDARLGARLLLAHVLGCTVTDLFVHPERTLIESQARAYCELVARRARHEPVAYLVGHRAFLDIDFAVDARVLIPRPETEHLVEQALAVARRWPRPRLVDVGTGSGVIAVSLAVHLPWAQVYAVDSSAGALEVARENARRHGVAGQIVFLQGDLLAPLPAKVEIVVANLPYVSEAEYAALAPDIRLYEPREALVSGEQGLDAIRALLDTTRPHLVAGGVILIEIGASQGEAVYELAMRAFPDAQVEIVQDEAYLDRVVRIEPGT